MAACAKAAVSLIDQAESPPSLAILDLDLPDLDGLALGARLRERSPHLQVIILTGHASLDSALSAMRSGTADYLLKPVDPDVLVRAVELGEGRWRSSRVEAALLGNLERFRALIENLNEVVTVIKPNGRIVYESPAVKGMLGYDVESRLGKPYADSVHDEDRRKLEACIEDVLYRARNARCSVRIRDVHDEWKSVEISANRVFNDPAVDGLVLTMVDVTDRLRLETRLRQSEKMEAIGRLTGGLAHELNNLLAIVMANVEAVIRDLPDDSILLQDITDAHHAARQGARLIEKLLGFSRQERLMMRPTNIATLIERTARMVRHTLPTGVKLVTCPPDTAECVAMADTDAVAHIVVNLINNACDAMSDGGCIEVCVRAASIDEDYVAEHAGAVAGDYVELMVRDDGNGMEPEVLKRVFEPFFSTKSMSHGTGLGMAMVYGLMKQMNGYVQLSSRPGAGTTVKLYLPATNEEVPRKERTAMPVFRSMTGRRSVTGNRSILIAEDQKPLRRAIQRAVERLGYTVVAAADGVEALECLNAAEKPFGLLIADIVMPRMGGLELHAQLVSNGIDVPTLYTSGFTANEIQEGKLLDSGVPLLRKPWTIEELAVAVEDAISRVGHPNAVV
jgi:PAS domain S-box-containing protein